MTEGDAEAQPHEVSKAVLWFEGRKIAMNHDKNGIVLKVAIHPDDFPPDLMKSPLGQRYMLALVALSDHEKPIIPKSRREIDKVLALAQTLPRNERFQKWLMDKGEGQ